ncbi:TetR/AcrR family transcriptional regulator [Acidovorax sp.]|uniref:TetR/AcrR family transcriptional regulator n=1 Tax=Acidovorax sp. TaxID=1872122 RepID=UPI0026216903|nr:TetR/AcrR family transcriptional regulator [Acidovorax sp.]
MPEAHRRLKQPQQIRSQLLAVVRDLLVHEGPHAVTLDAVARQANVTKGGLQHHFRSKQALLDTLSEQLLEEFSLSYENALRLEADTPGRHARAYIRTCFDDHAGCDQADTLRAIGLLALTSPTCRERWHAIMKEALAADGQDTHTANLLLACRLAGDGFWFAQMLDVYELDAQRKASLLELLLKLCGGEAQP